MARRVRRIRHIFILTVIVMIIGTFFSLKQFVSANTINLKIETNPASELFLVENMAPGDTISRDIRVKNSGDTAFTYTVSSRIEDGSEELFHRLKIKLEHNGSILTESNLSDLQNFDLGDLGVNSYREYTFTVHFPFDAGNELQGLSTKVAFDFVATAQGVSPVDPTPPDDPTPVDPTPPDDPTPVDPTPPDDPTPVDPTPPDDPMPVDPTLPDDPTPSDDPDTEQPTPHDPSQVPDDANDESSTDLPEANEPDSPSDQEQADGIELPSTSSPWYNIMFFSILIAISSIVIIGITIKIIRTKDLDA